LPHEVHDRYQIFCYVVYAAICHDPPPLNRAIAGIAPIKPWNRANGKSIAPYNTESRINMMRFGRIWRDSNTHQAIAARPPQTRIAQDFQGAGGGRRRSA
jgi:hypothetical protein